MCGVLVAEFFRSSRISFALSEAHAVAPDIRTPGHVVALSSSCRLPVFHRIIAVVVFAGVDGFSAVRAEFAGHAGTSISRIA